MLLSRRLLGLPGCDQTTIAKLTRGFGCETRASQIHSSLAFRVSLVEYALASIGTQNDPSFDWIWGPTSSTKQHNATQRNVTQTNPTQPNEIQCNAMRCDATRRNATQTRVTQTTNGNERGQTPLTGAINHSSRIALAGACSNLGPSDFFPRSKLRASMGTRCPHAIQLVSWGLCTRKMKLEFASQCNGLLAVQLLRLETRLCSALLLSKILEEPISITGQTFAI